MPGTNAACVTSRNRCYRILSSPNSSLTGPSRPDSNSGSVFLKLFQEENVMRWPGFAWLWIYHSGNFLIRLSSSYSFSFGRYASPTIRFGHKFVTKTSSLFVPEINAFVTSIRYGSFQSIPNSRPFNVTSAITSTRPRSSITRCDGCTAFSGSWKLFMYDAVPEKCRTVKSVCLCKEKSFSNRMDGGAPEPGGKRTCHEVSIGITLQSLTLKALVVLLLYKIYMPFSHIVDLSTPFWSLVSVIAGGNSGTGRPFLNNW